MHYTVQITDPVVHKSDCLLLGVLANKKLSTAAQSIDAVSGGYITKCLAQGDLTSEPGQSLLLYNVPNILANRVLLVSYGQDELNEMIAIKILRGVAAALRSLCIKQVTCYLTPLLKNRDQYWNIRQFIEIVEDSFYVFEQFKTKKKDPIHLEEIVFHIDTQAQAAEAEKPIEHALAIVGGMSLTKDLANLPANVCTPHYMAEQAKHLAQTHPLNCEILERKHMQDLGMGALLAVAQGSQQAPKFVILRYTGTTKEQAPIVLVGKGVTFDSGGISLKPSASMEEMKFDMAGAATVLGVLRAVVQLKLAINLIGLMPLTENLPSGTACKPGDVITSLSGQTIEIINTDAEGRLILSDALTYSERFNPKYVIDIATLTGAIVHALGDQASGLMSNHVALTKALEEAGQQSGDRVWSLPLWENYQEQINSNIADMSNVGHGGGKSITAACFLSRFTKKLSWAHLDIAGTAWKTGKDKTATARPVSLLVQFLLNCVQSDPAV